MKVATKNIIITLTPCKHAWSLQTYIHTYRGAPDKRPDKSWLCRSHYLLPPPSGTCSAVTLANVIHSPTSAHIQYSTHCAERILNASSVQFRFEVWLLLRHGLQAGCTSAAQRSIHFSCSKQHSLQLLKVAVLQQGGRRRQLRPRRHVLEAPEAAGQLPGSLRHRGHLRPHEQRQVRP